MRVLFTASNWPGHYFCMTPLGWALQAAGHDVRVACPAPQAAAISRAGLTPVPVLDSPDMMRMSLMMHYGEAVSGDRQAPGLPLHPYTGQPVSRLDEFDFATEAPPFWAACEDVVRRSYDGAVAFARSWRPDLVCHDLMTPEGALAAELTGVPSVYHPPGLFGTVETERGVDLGDPDPSGSFARYGLEPWSGTRIRFAVDPSPGSVALPFGDTVRRGMRYVPYNGPGGVPQWLRRTPGTRRVCVLWGSSAVGAAVQVPALRAAVQAAAERGAEVVLTTTPDQLAALGELPPTVRALRNFPLHLLLATSDAIVHHGSVNCLMSAAAAGVPQVGLPLTDEQIAVTRRMAGTGAAVSVPALSAGAEQAREAVHRVLDDPAYAAAASRLSAEMARQPAPADLVKPLEDLAATGRF
ncbi:nucleotide disphospho-sugar-binding domain-containing protein [Actinoplanes sp. NPDC049548]|uniref:nucleotide disphospho-sugar-binding domain-containing protein n=1 Tax=Actinoplanes sp. NPDC049548 TaxID=3155152 RepID=UPI003448886B